MSAVLNTTFLLNLTGTEKQKTLEQLICSPLVTDGIPHQIMYLSAINIFLSITAVLENTLILVALNKESSLHPPSKLFLRSLATTDLCVGLIAQPTYASYEISLLRRHWSVCSYTFATSFLAGYILCSMSLLTLSAISVDSLLALLLALRYRQVVTLKRTNMVVRSFLGRVPLRCRNLLLEFPANNIFLLYSNISLFRGFFVLLY